MRRILLPILLLMGILLAMPAASAISVSSGVTFQPSTQMTVHWNAPTVLSNITVSSGSISFNGYDLAATSTIGITITQWAVFEPSRYKEFTFLANTTAGTSIQFIFTPPGSQHFGGWTVLRDGVEYATGSGDPISFTNAEWMTDVDRTFTLQVSFATSEEEAWLIQFGPAWLTLLVFSAFILFIVSAFIRGVRKRRRSGKVWKYMPKRWR